MDQLVEYCASAGNLSQCMFERLGVHVQQVCAGMFVRVSNRCNVFSPVCVCVCGIAYDSLTKHMTCLAVDLENVTLQVLLS